jgi:hypothetical protein
VDAGSTWRSSSSLRSAPSFVSLVARWTAAISPETSLRISANPSLMPSRLPSSERRGPCRIARTVGAASAISLRAASIAFSALLRRFLL